MYIQTLARMMIGRTIVQKGETVSVSQKEGHKLLEKGDVLAVKMLDPADEKPKVTKPKPISIKDDPKDNVEGS